VQVASAHHAAHNCLASGCKTSPPSSSSSSSTVDNKLIAVDEPARLAAAKYSPRVHAAAADERAAAAARMKREAEAERERERERAPRGYAPLYDAAAAVKPDERKRAKDDDWYIRRDERMLKTEERLIYERAAAAAAKFTDSQQLVHGLTAAHDRSPDLGPDLQNVFSYRVTVLLTFKRTLDRDLGFQSLTSYGHDPYMCKNGQRSVGSKATVETDGRTRPIAVLCPLMRSVISSR